MVNGRESFPTAKEPRPAPPAPGTPFLSQRAMGFAAGVVSAGLALAFGELIDGISEAQPSLVVAVGELIADYTPGDVVATSIENLGSNQKWVLLAGITVATLLVGGALGRAAAGGRRDLAIGGFAAFGLLGGWATARNPFSSAAASWLVVALAAGIGLAALLFLTSRLRSASGPASAPTRSPGIPAPELGPEGAAAPDLEETGAPEPQHAASPGPERAGASEPDRRAFLAYAGGAGVVAGALVGIGRWVRGPSAAEQARSAIELPPTRAVPTTTIGEASVSASEPAVGPTVMEQVAGLDTFDGIDRVSTYLTSNQSFYRIDTAITPPQVDPNDWRLRITGMVDNPYHLDFEEILAMDLVDHVITLQCVSNQVGGKLVGNAVWTGVPLTTLLERAGVQPGATQIVGRSVDDWTAGFPTGLIGDGRNALLAVGMNGETLPVAHGFPARLIVAGLYGYVSAVKWISEIELNTWEGFDAYWVPRGWSKEGPMKTQSRIDVPRVSDRLAAGEEAVIAGVAWAPTRGVQAVHVRVDGGDWQPCELAEALGDESWVQWRRPWTPAAGRHTIEVRATDGAGAVQSEGPVPPRPDGAEGWHSVDVNAA